MQLAPSSYATQIHDRGKAWPSTITQGLITEYRHLVRCRVPAAFARPRYGPLYVFTLGGLFSMLIG